jgi:hypothetical protein
MGYGTRCRNAAQALRGLDVRAASRPADPSGMCGVWGPYRPPRTGGLVSPVGDSAGSHCSLSIYLFGYTVDARSRAESEASSMGLFKMQPPIREFAACISTTCRVRRLVSQPRGAGSALTSHEHIPSGARAHPAESGSLLYDNCCQAGCPERLESRAVRPQGVGTCGRADPP